jgi:hypothetical protein
VLYNRKSPIGTEEIGLILSGAANKLSDPDIQMLEQEFVNRDLDFRDNKSGQRKLCLSI